MFEDQVTSDVYVGSLLYAMCTVSVFLAAAGFAILDLGLVREKNRIDSLVQKLSSGAVCAAAFLPFGYVFWNIQVYEALGVPNPVSEAFSTWWIGGPALNNPPQDLDPELIPSADTYQVFFVAFLAFAFFFGVVLQTMGAERMRARAVYALSFLSGLVLLPATEYVLWGSASPLTRIGIHDNVGSFVVYVPLGVLALIVSMTLGPRAGRFVPHPLVGPSDEPKPSSIPLAAIGIFIVLPALIFISAAGGYLIPGIGYTGIAMTTSGFGLLLSNLMSAVLGASIVGAIISYITKDPYMAIAGPFIGYVSCTSFMDIGRPLTVFFVGAAASVVAYGCLRATTYFKIDEDKLVPLVLGPVVFGGIVGGFVGWGTPTGGYFDVDSGTFAFQSATVTPWGQLIGILVAAGIAAVIGLVVVIPMKLLGWLRVDIETETRGLDSVYWSESDEEDPAETTAVPPAGAEGGAVGARPDVADGAGESGKVII